MKTHIAVSSIAALALLAVPCVSQAATIIQPNTPTSNVAADAGSTNAGLVNGIGLSASVTTGTDTATALAATHANGTLSQAYVTNDPGAVDGDYYAQGGAPPVFTFTLGGTFNDVESILVWNYSQTAGGGVPSRNGARTFDLQFFSDAAATTQVGATISGLTLAQSLTTPQIAQQVFFGAGVNFDGVQSARMTVTDNYFGMGGGAGGDRVGLAEVRFSQVPEPSAALLGGLGALALLRRRRA
ncbi:MAG: PEP-CTERM sorting domain-containing protein [Verrucomicrobiota bacterium]